MTGVHMGLAILGALVLLVVGLLCWGRRFPGKRQKKAANEKRCGRKRCSSSHLIAFGVLAVDGTCTYMVLYLCYLSIQLQYAGSLPYLTTLIGALQAVTAVVLTAYFNKAKAENTKGGIVYDAAMWSESDHGDL